VGFSTIRYRFFFTIFITKGREERRRKENPSAKEGLMCQVDMHAWGTDGWACGACGWDG